MALSPPAHTHLLFLLPLRICCGWVLCTAGFGKVESGWLTHPHLITRIEEWLHAGRTYRFYVPVLHRIMTMDHPQILSIALCSLELLAGAALLCGLFSRWAAFCGFTLTLNLMLASGDGLGANPTAPLCAALLTLTLAGSGRVLGLDAALQGRVSPWLS
jgi:uncharacterized membrane protein YphA (DoxX/SURF4 family)